MNPSVADLLIERADLLAKLVTESPDEQRAVALRAQLMAINSDPRVRRMLDGATPAEAPPEVSGGRAVDLPPARPGEFATYPDKETGL